MTSQETRLRDALTKLVEKWRNHSSGYSDMDDCADELEAALAAAPSGEAPSEETAWLIECSGLCMGFCEGRLTWVTFTDENALRFSRKIDAYNFKEFARWKPLWMHLEPAVVTEHMWTTPAAAEAREAEPPPLEACQCRLNDAWRCARDRKLTSIACPCECHRALAAQPHKEGNSEKSESGR
jgi:hypothetical protein